MNSPRHRRGGRYDAIVLDACDGTNDSPCPAKSFQKAATLNMLRRALTPTGSIVVNILSQDSQDFGYHWQKVYFNAIIQCVLTVSNARS
ncbi:hypothetical protein Y032_0303g1905 [Ancylostoma ceylanicum]|uniref:PABS domain-containing protein n=1 Tax=Ancylostoma ceylanicum TaxID=53326 RepID=A0A016S3H0_9BILA|nr:hypothetical protein Y032_0303g1905 [Ancylostoma ceylanicum]